MQHDFNGYNGTNTVLNGQTWKDLSSQGVHVSSCQPNLFRYPGGTDANYWNWREGRFLYNFEITSGVTGLKVLDKFINYNNNLLNHEDVLEEFKKSSDLTGSVPLFNLNLFTSDYPYQLAMLFHAKEIGLPVNYIELGNEFYNDFPEHRSVFPTVLNYSNKAKHWAYEIKHNATLGSAPQIAVVGAWQLPISEGRQRVWLDNLMPEIGNCADIDAVTIHQYHGTGFAGAPGLPPDGQCLSEVIGGSAGTPANANIMMKQAFDNIYDLKNNEFAKIAAYNKEIWITEFNMGDHTYATYGSWAQAMMVSAMMLTYLEEPNVAKVLPHELVSNAIYGAMFNGDADNLNYPTGGAPYNPVKLGCDGSSGNTYATGPCEKSASGNAVALLSKAIQESTHADQIDFNVTNITYLDAAGQYPVLYGWKFTKPNSTEYLILNLDYLDIDVDLKYLAGGTGNYERMYAPFDDYITGNPGGSTQHLPSVNTGSLNASADLLHTKAYSVTRVVFPNAPVTISLVATENHICFGTSTTLTAYDYTCAPNNLVWSVSPTAGSMVGDAVIKVTPASATNYTVTVTDPTSSTSSSMVIYVANPPTLTVTPLPASQPIYICPGSSSSASSATLTAALSNANSANYDFIWTPSFGLTSACSSTTNPAPFCNEVTVSPDSNTYYIVYATDGVCWVSNQASPVQIISNKPVIQSLTGPLIKCADNNNAILQLKTATAATSYSWVPSGGTVTNSSNVSIYSVNPSTSTIYTVTSTNGSGASACSITATVNLKVNQNCCSSSNSDDVIVYQSTGNFIADVDDLETETNNPSDDYETTVTGSGAGAIYTVSHVTGGTGTGIIFINGYFKVNRNLTFKDCIIQFGEQAEVHIDANTTLRFRGCTVTSCGSWTWRSIYADEDAEVRVEPFNTTDLTSIAGADTALNLSNNAQYQVINSEFSNNGIGIYLYNYMKGVIPKTNAGSIYGNSITYGIKGIDINFSEELTIGDPAFDANTFSNLNNGIYSNNGNFSALNNDFSTMITHDNFGGSGSGIYAYSDFYNDRTIQAGDNTANGANNFDDSPNGIMTLGQQHINITYNQFGLTNKLTGIGTSIYGNDGKFITIQNNYFKNYFIGTLLSKIYPGATVNIDGNTYTDADLTNTEDPFYGTAIAVTGKTLVTRGDNPFTITNNTIINPRLGIVVGNMDKVNVGTDNNGNTISYPFTSGGGIADYYLGVWMQNCSNMRVIGNTISNPPAVITGTTLFRGIDNETSTDGRINCNTITNIPYSMNFYANCDGTLLRNNSMTEYDEAVHLDGATLPDQYQWNDVTSDEEPMHNVWNDAAADDRVTGTKATINPINWYYETGQTDQNPDPTGLSSLVAPVQDNPGNVYCDDYSNRQSREERYGALVGDSLQFDEYADENLYYAKQIALKGMKGNSSILVQNNAGDAAFQNFYEATEQSNIGILDSINNLVMDSSGVAMAIALNNNLNDTNTIEYYKKLINDIYLNKSALNIALDGNDSAVCDYVSSLSYHSAGNSIYLAAALIGKEIHPAASSGMKLAANPVKKNVSTPAFLQTFPNPASNKIFITGLNDENGYVEVFDVEGKIVIRKLVKGDIASIDVSHFANGVYRLNVYYSSNKVHSANFTVSR